MKLIIAEKPSVARDIARVLKATVKSEGCLKNDEYVVTWALGHLVALCEPEDYNPALKRWKPEDLPIIPEQIRLKSIKKTAAHLKILKKWMGAKEVTGIVCATDAGREGELIFRYIYEFVKCRKPVQRLWISSMTDGAILQGFAALRPGNDFDNLYHSARCRSHADWLVGINASRAYSLAHNAHISVGRVQTPTLAMIVARQQEIDNFVSKDFWEVEAQFSAAQGSYPGKWFDENAKDGRLDNKERADEIAALVQGQDGIIKSLETEEKRQPPPLLHDLPELQRDCNRKFGYTAAKTLSIAQDLYEKRKLITYPRTDSRYLSSDIKTAPIIAALATLPEYLPHTKYIQSLNLPLTRRMVDDAKVTDHHAIIPTEKKATTALSTEERNVYSTIARRFLAAHYPAFVQDVTTVITIAVKEKFLSRGAIVRQLGWRELYCDEKNEDETGHLPILKQQEPVRVDQATVKAKKTRPPKPYTEATLLSAMENAGKLVEDEEIAQKMKESGLGTAATRAAIIERLLTVGYIERRAKTLLPTEKANALIQILPNEITSPETTGRWEKGLASISSGNLAPERFMASINRFVHFLVQNGKASPQNPALAQDRPRGRKSKKGQKAQGLGKCPLCAADVLENAKAFYCAKWRGGCTFKIWKNATANYNVNLTPQHISALLSGKTVSQVQITMPDTKEKAVADLTMDAQSTSVVRFINLKRIDF